MNKPLKFFHVPKTGGSSIAHAAKEFGILWGALDPDYIIKWKTSGSRDHQPLYQAQDENIYQKWLNDWDFFCVVRNPYEKCISEFFFGEYRSQEASIERFNETIQKRISENRISNHWCPQYLFVYHDEKQIIRHVLKYENLQKEFDDLMEEYNLPIRLTYRSNVGNKKYSISDLDSKTIRMINELHKEDFHI